MSGAPRLLVRATARADILDILDELLERAGPAVCIRFRDGLRSAFEFVAEHPAAGWKPARLRSGGGALRCWRVPGFPRYLVFYAKHAEGVDIVRVLHGARDLPRVLAARRRRRRARD